MSGSRMLLTAEKPGFLAVYFILQQLTCHKEMTDKLQFSKGWVG